MTDPSRPWVLLRKGMSKVTAETLENAKFSHDVGRRNRSVPPARIFGPNGEGWYCGGSVDSQWFRDDIRRTREERQEEVASQDEEDVSA